MECLCMRLLDLRRTYTVSALKRLILYTQLSGRHTHWQNLPKKGDNKKRVVIFLQKVDLDQGYNYEVLLLN